MAKSANKRPAAQKPALARQLSIDARPRALAFRELLQSMVTLLLVTAAVCLVYGRAIDAPFIFDDNDSILENASIRRLWPLVSETETPGPLNAIKDAPTGGRPLVNLSLAINYRLGEFSPRGYHLLNIAVHVLSALLLAVIVRRTLQLDYFGGRFDAAAWPLSTIVALIWAVHPLQTESVIYVTQRTELFVSFFYLGTLYCSLRYWTADSSSSRATWLVLATLSSLAGAASKEVIVSAPLVVLLFERTFLTGSFRQAVRQSWPLYLGLLLGWVLLLALNYDQPRGESAGFHLELDPYVWWFTQAKILWMYLKLVVLPWPLVIHYHVPYLESPGDAWPWLFMCGLLMALTVWLVRRRTAAGFLLAAMWLILSPTLIVPVITEVAAERRMYLPLAALVTIFTIGVYALARRTFLGDARQGSSDRGQSALLTAAAAVLILVLSSVSARHLSAYETELGVWQNALVHQPDDPVVRLGLGNTYIKMQQIPQAIEQFDAAIRLKPNYGDAYNNLAGALLKAGRQQEALELFDLAVTKKPKLAHAHFNYAVALLDAGRLQESIDHFQTALNLKPSDASAQYALGTALYRAGRLPEAIEALQLAVHMRPDHADSHNHLGLALERSGQLSQGIEQYREALRLKPESAEAHYNLANALLKLNQPQLAAEHFQKAIQYARSNGQTALADAIEAKLRSRADSSGRNTVPVPTLPPAP